jgi:hypothetical protein
LRFKLFGVAIDPIPIVGHRHLLGKLSSAARQVTARIGLFAQ